MSDSAGEVGPPTPSASGAVPARVARGRSATVRSVVAGVLVAALVALVAAAVLTSRPPQWSSTASLLVVPEAAGTDPDLVAGLYDALSRGQVPATYAELLRQQQLTGSVSDGLGLSAEDAAAVELEVQVVPDTSVLDLVVTTSAAQVSQAVASEVAVAAADYLNDLESPYEVVVTGDAAGVAERAGLARMPLAAVVAALALFAGLAVQQAVWSITLARGPRDEGAAVPAAT